VTENEKVLFVDDELNVLKSIKRQFRKVDFRVDFAQSGEEALEKFKTSGPYMVVISDMRMPEMDGVQLLSQIKKIFPDTVRLMLTGNGDQEIAVQAINEVGIFRFLTKPCSTATILSAVNSAIRQYYLIITERELLDKTLKGSIKVMTEILSQVNPTAFSRCMRIKKYVTKIATRLGRSNVWEFPIAGLLSQIGCVTVPNEILEKRYSGKELSPGEQEIFDNHPLAGAKFLSNIPRLENISQMINMQKRPFSSYMEGPTSQQEQLVALGGQLLKAAIDFDFLVYLGNRPKNVLKNMKKAKGEYNPKILEILASIDGDKAKYINKKLQLGQITIGMKLNQDLRAKNGLLLAIKGQEITFSLRERLINFSKTIGIDGPFEVLVKA